MPVPAVVWMLWDSILTGLLLVVGIGSLIFWGWWLNRRDRLRAGQGRSSSSTPGDVP